MSVDPVDAAPEPDGVRVRAHPSLCQGWGNCHRFASEVYHLDEHGEIAFHRLEVPAEHALEAWIGASVCPAQALSVIGEPEAYWQRRRDAEAGTPDTATTTDTTRRSP